MNTRRKFTKTRSGFTLVETLVTLGIISLLLALLMPAVQSARESARRTQCAGHLHQIVIAVNAFETNQRKYPLFGWAGYNSPGGPPLSENNTPHVQILPYIGQSVVWNQIDPAAFHGTFSGVEIPQASPPINSEIIRTTIPLYQCPSDQTIDGSCSYRVNVGPGADYYETPPTGLFAGCYDPLNGKGAFVTHHALGAGDFPDGLSQTAFLSERVIGDGDNVTFDPWRDFSFVPTGLPICTGEGLRYSCQVTAGNATSHASFAGYTWFFPSKSQTAYDHVLTPNSKIPDCSAQPPSHELWNAAITARSQHPGIVNVAFGDGSVRGISSLVDSKVWKAMGTRNGKETFQW